VSRLGGLGRELYPPSLDGHVAVDEAVMERAGVIMALVWRESSISD
jgi:hypothetical protein